MRIMPTSTWLVNVVNNRLDLCRTAVSFATRKLVRGDRNWLAMKRGWYYTGPSPSTRMADVWAIRMRLDMLTNWPKEEKGN